MKKIAVIGSNSFSGSDFIDHVLDERDYKVLAISRSPEKGELFLPYKINPERRRVIFHQMDLNKDMERLKGLLAEERPAYIVNFAAQSEVAPSWRNPEQWFQTNAASLAALINFLKDQKWLERYLHISSPEVYGTCSGVVREDAPLNPSTPYAASKAAGDLLLFTYVKNFGFPLVMIRSTNVYGAYQQLFKIIPRSVIYIKLGRKIELHGGGRAVKSYIHIRDISRGELAALEQGRPGAIYHLSPEAGIAVRDVVRIICEVMGRSLDQATSMVEERLGQDAAYVIDSTSARQEFQWASQVGFEQGLTGVVKWVEKYWDAIQKESLEYQHQP
ncbi:MAG: GDP-mannose 4,6-dehydratase [Thermodesulfobacteriota bacterium]